MNELRRHIYANSIARHTLRRLLEKVFVPCKCPTELSANNSGQSIKSCKRHERAIDIDEIVAQLDVPSENIMTLLCYLEAHPKKWIDILPQSYTMCKVSVYGGEMQLRKACKTVRMNEYFDFLIYKLTILIISEGLKFNFLGYFISSTLFCSKFR